MLLPKQFRFYLWWWLGAGVFLAAVLFFNWKTATPIKFSPVVSGPIIVIGDEFVVGYGALLAQALGRELQIYGEPGATSYKVFEIAQREIPKQRPRLVILTMGMNDIALGIPNDTFYGNMNKTFGLIHDSGAMVAVVGLDPPQGGWLFTHLRNLANDSGVLFINEAMRDIWLNPALMASAKYPNEKGFALLAARISAALKPHLGEQPKN